MAVPTFIRILPAGTAVGTPAEGPTAGRALVEIYGSGFRVPPAVPPGPSAPPVNGVVYAPAQQTVRVRFGGADAVRVDVIRSNLLRVLTPVCPLAVPALPADPGGLVALEVTNLDDNGDPIPGETLIVPDAYTYRMVKLDASTESDFTRAIRTLLRMWKLQVLANVVLTQHTDYDPDVSTGFVEVADVPAIVLSGPSTPENRFYSLNEDQEINIGGIVEVRRKARTIDLVFRVIGISDSATECLNLMALAIEFMNRNPYFEVQRDVADASKGNARYEFAQTQEFETGSRPNASNIHFFTGEVVIRGFDIEGFAGIPRDELRNLGVELTEDVNIETGGPA